jgi:hypothetical protein
MWSKPRRESITVSPFLVEGVMYAIMSIYPGQKKSAAGFPHYTSAGLPQGQPPRQASAVSAHLGLATQVNVDDLKQILMESVQLGPASDAVIHPAPVATSLDKPNAPQPA